MKKSRTTTIIVSLLLVLALLAGLLVATYALFTDEERVNNHLQAGNLDIELQIDSVKGNGYVDGVLEDDIDYTPANTNDKIFNSDNFFPAMYQEATLTLLNNGSLPFDYTLEFEITKDSGLAKYIDVTVTDKDGKVLTADDATLESLTVPVKVGSMKGDEKQQQFKVRVKFDSSVTEVAAGASIDFDILVVATQAGANA